MFGCGIVGKEKKQIRGNTDVIWECSKGIWNKAKKTKRNHRIEKRAVLLITSSIVPQEKRFLILKEPKQRLSQYLDSLRFYIVHTNLNNIVLCDNSGFNFPVDEMTALAKEYGKKLEIIQFVGDKKKIIENGKGYGEGEIIEYALHHSLLLKNHHILSRLQDG